MKSELQSRVVHIAGKRWSRWIYSCARLIIKVTLFPYFKVQTKGVEHLNMGGPVILAPVHRSNLDAPMIGGAGKRRFRSLAKESLFPNSLATTFMASLGAFPVRRGVADRESIRSAVRILKSGEQMLIFPEGSRKTGTKIVDIYDGVAYLACKTGAAVVPVGVAGTESAMATGSLLPQRKRVAVVAGAPIWPPTQADQARQAVVPVRRVNRTVIAEFTETITERMQEVFDEAQAMIEHIAR